MLIMGINKKTVVQHLQQHSSEMSQRTFIPDMSLYYFPCKIKLLLMHEPGEFQQELHFLLQLQVSHA
jgi:hypothetical protein